MQRSGEKGMIRFEGKGLSPGLARGTAYVYVDVLESRQTTRPVPEHLVGAEYGRILDALDAVRRHLADAAEKVGSGMGKEMADIFLAHQAMLNDPQLAADLEAALREKRINAERIVELVFRRWSRRFRAAPSPMLNERADDIDDLYRRMVGVLAGVQAHRLESLPEGSLLVARRLLPSDTVFLSARTCAGILLVEAGSTSHATILARELGIPCVGRLPASLLDVETGDELLMDGGAGEAVVHPTDAAIRAFTESRDRSARSTQDMRKRRFEEAVTGRGERVRVLANASTREDVERAAACGAEGIGLFRTEAFFLAAPSLPGADEFAAHLEGCLAAMAEKETTLRLLDIGGDKNIPYLSLPFELNPFLGRRGIRLLFEYPMLLETQLEAMLLVSRRHRIRILVPMATFPEEMSRVRTGLQALSQRMGVPSPPLGAMIETPAAALSIPAWRGHADFFCIGTNDLTQYVMAADRESALVGEYFRDDHPIILELLRTIAQGAGELPVTLCGELAAKPAALARILDTGIKALSMAASAIPSIKEAIRNL
jgi:phosphoenolpyruvate-protein phosphotransferase